MRWSVSGLLARLRSQVGQQGRNPAHFQAVNASMSVSSRPISMTRQTPQRAETHAFPVKPGRQHMSRITRPQLCSIIRHEPERPDCATNDPGDVQSAEACVHGEPDKALHRFGQDADGDLRLPRVHTHVPPPPLALGAVVAEQVVPTALHCSQRFDPSPQRMASAGRIYTDLSALSRRTWQESRVWRGPRS